MCLLDAQTHRRNNMLKKLETAAWIVFIAATTLAFVAIPFAIAHDFHKAGIL
jgi:hypothetical protein